MAPEVVAIDTYEQKVLDFIESNVTEQCDVTELMKKKDPSLVKPPPYNEAIDIYSAGVVLGCLLYKVDEKDVSQKMIGKWRKKIQNKRKRKVLSNAHELFYRMTMFDAQARPSAEACLAHAFLLEK